jgi:hypothetical protein
MRIKVNVSCNVLTDEHSNAYRSPGRVTAPEITVPSLRARMTVGEAERLARHLLEAVAVAKKAEAEGTLA